MTEQNTSLIPNQFYGKRSGTTSWHLVEKRVKMMQENPLSVIESPHLLGDTQIWSTFPRQLMALNFAKKMGMGLLTFAFEGKTIGEGGRRSFLVCYPRILWLVMKDRPLSKRCFYEVIPEFQVCKLYFDIEFLIDLNPTLCGVRATQKFIHIVNYYLEKEFGVKCGLEHVLDLDSTTPVKFSRHLIYNLEKVGFASNVQVGYFVKMICDELGKVVQGFCNSPIPHISKDDIENLFVKADSSTVMICDLAVYSKNRNFRTFGSTKYGKQVPLVISAENHYIPSQSSDEQYFLDSLITFVDDDIKILTYEGEMNPGEISRNNATGSNESCLSSKTSFSPYIEIEKFINNYLGGDNLIRTWYYFNQDELLVFEIDKQHRFCANIGREHKSNSVMYVVNLKKGVFYQKCYDPNCHGFKSCEMALPPETMPWKLDNMLDSWTTTNDVLQQNSSVMYDPQIALSFQKPTGPSSHANATQTSPNFTRECSNTLVEESNFTNSISDDELLRIKF